MLVAISLEVDVQTRQLHEAIRKRPVLESQPRTDTEHPPSYVRTP